MQVEILRREQVVIPKEECTRLAINKIEQAFGLVGLFIKNDDCLYREDITIHSTIDTKVRKVTPDDLMALAVIKKLKE